MSRLPIYSTDKPAGWHPDPLPVLPEGLPLYLDCESDGTDWQRGSRAVGWAWRCGDLKGYAPYRHAGGGNLPQGQVLRWLDEATRGRQVVNAWLKFDMHLAKADGVDLDSHGRTFRDVMHTEALLDDWLRDFSLEGTAQRRLGVGKLDPAPKDMLGELPAWDVAAYAIRDVDLVKGIHEQQQPLLVEQGLLRVQALEDRVLAATFAMEHHGCPINETLLDAWLDETEDRYGREAFALSRDVGFSFDPDRAADMARLFKLCGVSNPHRTAKGAQSFRAEFVDAQEHPFIKRASGLGKLKDLRSKFFVPYRAMISNGRLWPTFHQLMIGEEGTISGRFSCVRPNVQQVLNPGKFKRFVERFGLNYNVRALFIPDVGQQWFSADQKQVEYRLAAHFAYAARKAVWRDRYGNQIYFSDKAREGAEHIIAIYRDNPDADFHDTVGEMVRPYRPGLNRTEIKITNFRKLYGGGVQSTADALGISFEDADALITQYDHAFPSTKAILDCAKSKAETRGYVTTLSGRRCRFPTQERTYKALNGIVQGSAADDFKLAFVTAHESRDKTGFTPYMVVHDELGGGLQGDAAEISRLLNEQRSNTYVPILWDTGTGANWAEAKG